MADSGNGRVQMWRSGASGGELVAGLAGCTSDTADYRCIEAGALQGISVDPLTGVYTAQLRSSAKALTKFRNINSAVGAVAGSTSQQQMANPPWGVSVANTTHLKQVGLE